MLKKLKASLGIGSATVDTVLDQDSAVQGSSISGKICIQGGDTEQKIDGISLTLCTEVKVESDSGKHYVRFILGKLDEKKSLIIEANEAKEIPFTMMLPGETPITALNAQRNQCKVWIETQLDIDFALDPKDRDYLSIHPLPAIQYAITAMEREGFNLVKADVEKGFLNGGHFKSTSGCYQELEFRNNAFFSRKEIELSFVLHAEKIHCLVEIDRTFGNGDSYRSFTLRRDASEAEVEQALVPILHG